MSASAANRLRVANLNPHRAHAIDIRPDDAARAALAQELGLTALPAVRLDGTLSAQGAQDWLFEGRLRAEVVQPCVITLAPVKTRLDEAVRRLWSPDAAHSDAEEAEMGDDEIEPLGTVIDLNAVLAEALALALPLYPRAEGAGLADADAAADGPADGPDDARDDADAGETRRPFAGLKDLLGDKG